MSKLVMIVVVSVTVVGASIALGPTLAVGNCQTCLASGTPKCVFASQGATSCTASVGGCDLSADNCGADPPGDPCCGGPCCLADILSVSYVHVFRLPGGADLTGFPVSTKRGGGAELKQETSKITGIALENIVWESALLHVSTKKTQSPALRRTLAGGDAFQFTLEYSTQQGTGGDLQVSVCRYEIGGPATNLADVTFEDEGTVMAAGTFNGEPYVIAVEHSRPEIDYWEANHGRIQEDFWSEFAAVGDPNPIDLEIAPASACN